MYIYVFIYAHTCIYICIPPILRIQNVLPIVAKTERSCADRPVCVCKHLLVCVCMCTCFYLCVYIRVFRQKKKQDLCRYVVALVSRIDKIIGLFCKRVL